MLTWAPLPDGVLAAHGPFDFVVVADCVYNAAAYDALVATLAAVVAGAPRAVVVVANLDRHGSEDDFFARLAAAGFALEPVVGCDDADVRATARWMRPSDTFYFYRATMKAQEEVRPPCRGVGVEDHGGGGEDGKGGAVAAP